MVVTTKELHDHAKILEHPEARTNPNVLLDKLREYEQNCKRHNITFIRIWRINVIVAVVTAVVAVSILGFNFMRGLFAEP